MVQSSPNRESSWMTWGIALAAVSLLTIGGGSLIWKHKVGPAEEPSDATSSTPPRLYVTAVEIPTTQVDPAGGLHAIDYAIENGKAVLKIRVVPEGDELVVEASTGRLIESRPSRPAVPAPSGRLLAPFSPMM